MEKLIIISIQANDNVKSNLSSIGKIVELTPNRWLPKEVSCHPDMIFSRISNEKIVYAPDTDDKVLSQINSFGIELIQGSTYLQYSYPNDIAYNTLYMGRIFFHNINYTDAVVCEEYKKKLIKPIHVKQGYTGCTSIGFYDKNCIITADSKVSSIAEAIGFNVLRIPNTKEIILPGYEYGFIGGGCGYDLDKTLFVNGDIEKLSYGTAIKKYLQDKDILIKSLSKKAVVDIGGIQIFTK